MPKIDDELPLEQNYQILSTAIGQALTKLQLAMQQLEAAKCTLASSAPALADTEGSPDAAADCGVDLVVAQMMSSRALSHVWGAAEPLSEALGFDEESQEEDEEGD